jgi:hypothetical protein
MCLERHLSHFFGKKTLEIHGNSRTKCFTSPCVIDSQPSMLYLSPFTIQIANRLLYPTNKSAISMVIYIYYIRQFPTKTLSDLSAFPPFAQGHEETDLYGLPGRHADAFQGGRNHRLCPDALLGRLRRVGIVLSGPASDSNGVPGIFLLNGR